MTDIPTRRLVLAGVDGSLSAEHAVRWAALEAARRQVPLLLFHACYVPPTMPYVPVSLPRSYGDAVVEQGRAWLDDAERVAVRAAPTVAVRKDLRTGQAADHLIRESASAGLVVLGSRGLGGFSGMLVGSTAVALAAHGHCPVVVVRGRTPDDPPPETGPVVVGVDGSPDGDAAVEFGFEAAASRGAPLHAVHTWNDLSMSDTWSVAPLGLDYDRIAEDERRMLAERLSGWQHKYPDVRLVQHTIKERPARGLLARAEGAQLIVVGSRGLGGFRGMLVGSTSQALLHHSKCPVAVVRPDRAVLAS
ncbi:universal stress protein [Amycolatopsis cihanbeyliensis]|uniref:Nucleotide-binding universal stress UspA family protein n=1 Tax=Amycolatopsis cihanbeyliensis TaxID=1128664 RepID=A0A542DFC2_AMYCI|nr:universal stress protein [Amycolatopsis cihanbeyliensis]TQJ01756.1 nucleotide-binding universal stress UspA family protein [Amycolatopsis cihanbeyliensis]